MSKPQRVLVTEDDLFCSVLVRDILEDKGYEVVQATDGLEALAEVARTPPDLILLDITMPRLDGKETCRRLKANPQTREIPVVILSANSSNQDIQDCFELGAADYLIKPVEPSRLIKKVEAALRKAAFAQKLERHEADPGGLRQLADRREQLARLRTELSQFLGYVEHPLANILHRLEKHQADAPSGPEMKEVATRVYEIAAACMELQSLLSKLPP